MRKEYKAHKSWKVSVVLFSVLLISIFYLLDEFRVLYFLVPACILLILYFLNYKFILTEEYFAMSLIPYLWYWKIKNEDIYEICQAKDFRAKFKKYYPNKKIFNRPLLGGGIITKSTLSQKGIGVGIFPENLQELIRDFNQFRSRT